MLQKFDKSEISYKLIMYDDLLISIDRLSRFKHPTLKYKRVYFDLLTKYLMSPKLSKKQLESLSAKVINSYIELIWSNSVNALFKTNNKYNLFNLIKETDEKTFNINDEYTTTLMKASLDIDPFLAAYDNSSSAQNIKLLKLVYNHCSNHKKYNYSDVLDLRNKYKLLFPISTLVLVEGITEEILLPEFAKKLNFNFNQKGIFVLGAGGKSKVFKLYSDIKNDLKIPIVILLDLDAKEIYSQIKTNLRKTDKIILINNGEFEDILPKKLVKRAINASFYDIQQLGLTDLKSMEPMCKILSDLYKTRGLGEFQKAQFAKAVAENIKYKTDASDEIIEIINKIKSVLN